jgi:hypothetical protein
MKSFVPAAIAAIPLLVACPKQNTPPSGNPPMDALTALGLLMKNDINPAFSKLTFLVFHGDSMDEEPDKLKTEMANAAAVLRTSIAQLRTWKEPPTQSVQGREVFYTYATSVDASTKRLADALDRNDNGEAARQMKQISDTCNSCHHFFRLKIEDSVVPDRP